MKFLPLLFANLGRKKIRTLLTIGSFAVALFLFGLLLAVRSGFRMGIDLAGADRLVVMGTSLVQLLPLPHSARIERIHGVEDVTHLFPTEEGQTLLLFDVQAHSVRDGTIGGSGARRGSALLFLDHEWFTVFDPEADPDTCA